jgi:MSHA pilin protein MshA
MIELVMVMVIVILGVLAAIALPKFVDLQKDARTAKVQDMAGRVMSFVQQVHAKCIVNATCKPSSAHQVVTFPGVGSLEMQFGWPDAVDNLNSTRIDRFVDTVGWTATLPAADGTSFRLNSAPDPANCAAVYWDACYSPSRTTRVSTITTGC